jgi:hypothetical protein
MKIRNSKKMLSTLLLVSVFLIMFLPQAKAWKLFGTEKSDRIGINELACGPGCVGESYSYTTYFLGIPVGSGTGIDCFCD